jgi:hypothetical protein
MGEMFQNASSLKPLGQLKPNCPGMIIGRSSAKFSKTVNNINQRLSRACIVHLVIKKNNWSYVKTMSCSGSHLGSFFSEATRTVETKLPRNDHWKVLCKISVCYADRKSKMAATVIHRLTLDPMGKCSNAFFSETTNILKHFPHRVQC